MAGFHRHHPRAFVVLYVISFCSVLYVCWLATLFKFEPARASSNVIFGGFVNYLWVLAALAGSRLFELTDRTGMRTEAQSDFSLFSRCYAREWLRSVRQFCYLDSYTGQTVQKRPSTIRSLESCRCGKTATHRISSARRRRFRSRSPASSLRVPIPTSTLKAIVRVRIQTHEADTSQAWGGAFFGDSLSKNLLAPPIHPSALVGGSGSHWIGFEKVSGFSWIESDRFDIEAKAEDTSNVSEEQLDPNATTAFG